MRAALPDDVALEVDGGIHQDTAEPVVQAGANLLVAGSAVFGSDDPAATYESIVEPPARSSRRLARGHRRG